MSTWTWSSRPTTALAQHDHATEGLGQGLGHDPQPRFEFLFSYFLRVSSCRILFLGGRRAGSGRAGDAVAWANGRGATFGTGFAIFALFALFGSIDVFQSPTQSLQQTTDDKKKTKKERKKKKEKQGKQQPGLFLLDISCNPRQVSKSFGVEWGFLSRSCALLSVSHLYL